jgi:uncharacterized protein (UPF0332 family)
MSIKPRDLLSIARQQAVQETEIWRRSAISRAYYAAYHRCRLWELALPAPGSNAGPAGGIHQDLINRLSNPAPECGPELAARSRACGAQLRAQRQRRVDADYEIDAEVSQEDLRKQLDAVEQLLARCDEAMPESVVRRRALGAIRGGTPPPNPTPADTRPSAPR